MLCNSALPSFLCLTEAYRIATGRVWRVFFFCFLYPLFIYSCPTSFRQKYYLFSLLCKQMFFLFLFRFCFSFVCLLLLLLLFCCFFFFFFLFFFSGKFYIVTKDSSAQTAFAQFNTCLRDVYRTRRVLDFRSVFHEISCTCFHHLFLYMQIKNIVDILY